MLKSTLSKISGVSNAHISEITNFKANPSITIMESIAEALKIPLVELLIDHGQKDVASIPDGYERVTAVLTRYKAFIVRKWEKELQKKHKSPTKSRLKKSL